MPMTTLPLNLFVSYAHKDEDLRDQLATHLRLLERQGVISSWHDRKISPGIDWVKDIDENLSTADIVLLLISSDFLASDYCYDEELQQALANHKSGRTRVIPVVLRPCDWTSAPFGNLQALPIAHGTGAKPVTTWDNRDEAFLAIAQGIRRVAQELRADVSDRQSPSSPPLQLPDTINQTLQTMSDQSLPAKYNFLQVDKVQIFEKVDTYNEQRETATVLDGDFPKSMTGKPQRIQQEIDNLTEVYDLLTEKLQRLRRDFAIQAGSSISFQLEKEIEQAEVERAKIERKLGELDK
jgi:TIR domain